MTNRSPRRAPSLEQAQAHCLAIARNHYENFPVASHVLPARLRTPVAVLYAFARTADDFADEGHLTPDERLARLAAWRGHLDRLQRGEPPTHPVFVALDDVRRRFRLELGLMYDLIDAFEQDVTKRRYANEAELLSYCSRSANPVGRLLLQLTEHPIGPEDLAQSDAICTALQRVNFLQDLAQDYDENDRIYIPQDALTRHGVGEAHFATRRTDDAMRALMAEQRARAATMLESGAPLAWRLRGRVGLELRFIVLGVRRIIERLEARQDDVFSRPRLRRRDWGRLLVEVLTTPGP